MKKLLSNIYKIYRDPKSRGWGYSYLVKRPQGNIFFPRMAKSASVLHEFDAIHAEGGISSIYITDFHFAGKNVDVVAKEYDAPIFCSDIELPKIQKRGIRNLISFKFEQHSIEKGLSVIPTPGHTSGGVCYLLTLNKNKYLFTGDFLYFDGLKWIVGNTTFSKVKSSLEKLKNLNYDYLVGCGDDTLGTPYIKMNGKKKEAFFDGIASSFN
jgi:glyoxylase-like metal-dependent hydrolase (beta-lactamase superfamily II)